MLCGVLSILFIEKRFVYKVFCVNYFYFFYIYFFKFDFVVCDLNRLNEERRENKYKYLIEILLFI